MQSEKLANFIRAKGDAASIFSESSSHLAYKSKAQISSERNVLFKPLSKDAFVKESPASTRYPSNNQTPARSPLVSGRSLNATDQLIDDRKPGARVPMRTILKSRGFSSERAERNIGDDRFLSSYTSSFKYIPVAPFSKNNEELKGNIITAMQQHKDAIKFVKKEEFLNETSRKPATKLVSDLENKEIKRVNVRIKLYYLYTKKKMFFL